MYFTKLTTHITKTMVSKDSLKGDHYQTHGSLQYYRLTNHYTLPKIMLDIIDVSKPQGLNWVESIGRLKVAPHFDYNVNTGINFYLYTGDSKTTFYKVKLNTSEPTKLAGKDYGTVYTEDQLEEMAYFKPLAGEAFLLNSSKIHSVDMSQRYRVFIQFNWRDITYSEVLNKLQPWISN